MFIFLTVLQALIAAALVGVILMQQSEGGGLGVGGSPSGLMSARGAADFLTRATAVLATLFVILSIVLAGLAVRESGGHKIDTSLNRTVPTPGSPANTDPLAGAAPPASLAPQPASSAADPLAGAAAVPAPVPAAAPVPKASPSVRVRVARPARPSASVPVPHTTASPAPAAPAPMPAAPAAAPAAPAT